MFQYFFVPMQFTYTYFKFTINHHTTSGMRNLRPTNVFCGQRKVFEKKKKSFKKIRKYKHLNFYKK
jgi:hypothetical protein